MTSSLRQPYVSIAYPWNLPKLAPREELPVKVRPRRGAALTRAVGSTSAPTLAGPGRASRTSVGTSIRSCRNQLDRSCRAWDISSRSVRGCRCGRNR